MNINDDALEALARHLSTEIECLEFMLDVLGYEADALRKMSFEDLSTIASRKEEAVNRHGQLAQQRTQLLEACTDSSTPINFTDLIEELALAAPDGFVASIERTRDLAAAIMTQNERNRLFAQSGHGLVSGLVRLVDIGRSATAQTYARNGHIRSNLLDAIPRGPQVCSA